LECSPPWESLIKSKRNLIAKVVRANADAIHFIKTDKEGTKAIFSKFLKLNDPEGLERAAKAYATIFPVNTLPTPEGVKTLLDDMAPRNPKAKAGRPKTICRHEFCSGTGIVGISQTTLQALIWHIAGLNPRRAA
jgi:hypothetical protein